MRPLLLLLLTVPAFAADPPSRFEDLDAPDDEPVERTAPDPAQILARGNRTLAVRGPAAALPIFQEGVEFHPDNPALRSQLAFCLIQTGEPQAAQTHIDAILAEHPEHTEAHWYGALVVYEAGDLRLAAERFTAVLGRLEAGTGQVPKAHWYRANALERLLLDPTATKDPTKAGLTQAEVDLLLESYDAYIALDPGAVDWPEVARKAAWVRQNRPGKDVVRWVAVKPAETRAQPK